MTRGRTLFAAGVVAGVVLAAAVLWVTREYRRMVRLSAEMAWLSEEEAAAAGQSTFQEVSSALSGVGPAFSAASCSACHAIPAVGGWGTVTTLRVARRNADGTFHAYADGPVVPLFSVPGHECQPVIPADANVFSRRLPISTFGSGLVDTIADDQIVALEDPGDRDGDGIRGRAARVLDRVSGQVRVGRFGWKAQQASLLGFTADAYLHELGVTSDYYPTDHVIGVPPERVRECDVQADPEDRPDVGTGLRSIDTFVSFMKSLPAPAPAPETVDTVAGSRVFAAIGCASCHRPQVAAVRAFSDFLLHDIGTGDGIPEGDAGPHEMRTAALWGIRVRRLFLHDGSATSIEDAISRHAGEAAATRRRFQALPAPERHQLLAFISSL